MAFIADDQVLLAKVRHVLQIADKPIYYGALARDLDVPGPGAIAKVTAALEALMQADFDAGRPFVAAMCEGKLSGGLPALGFFQMAQALGRYGGPVAGPEAVAFVAHQRALLARLRLTD